MRSDIVPGGVFPDYEHERLLRLDDESERKLLTAAAECNWRPRTLELLRDIVMLARDTG